MEIQMPCGCHTTAAVDPARVPLCAEPQIEFCPLHAAAAATRAALAKASFLIATLFRDSDREPENNDVFCDIVDILKADSRPPRAKVALPIKDHGGIMQCDPGGAEHEAQGADERDIAVARHRHDAKKYAAELRRVREEIRSWWVGERSVKAITRIDEVLGENS